MTPRIPIVGRLPSALTRRVRAAATRQPVRRHRCLLTARTPAVAGPCGARATTGA